MQYLPLFWACSQFFWFLSILLLRIPYDWCYHPHYDMKINVWYKSLSEPHPWQKCECDVQVRAAVRAQASIYHPGQGILPLWAWVPPPLEGEIHTWCLLWPTRSLELWCWRRLLRVPWAARRSNQSILKEPVLNTHWKDWCWSWNANTLATWCKELTHFKRPWCWERVKAGGQGDDRGWDGWMASLTKWTWVWVDSGSWGWTGRPGVLQSTGWQRVGHDWATELTELNHMS